MTDLSPAAQAVLYVVDYTCRYWVGKPDTTGIGKCCQVFGSLDQAERKAEQLKAKGSGHVKIRKLAK